MARQTQNANSWIDSSGSGAMLSPANEAKQDSVVSDKYVPLPSMDEDTWIPSSYLYAFVADSSGSGMHSIARAVVHMRDSIECFLRIHKANPDVVLIVRKTMNLHNAPEEILWDNRTPSIDA